MPSRRAAIACIFGLILSCGPAPEGPADTGFVGSETRVGVTAPPPAPVDQDGPVEIENVVPPSIYVVTQVSIDHATRAESGVVLVMKVGSDAPLARIASASISDLRVNDAGTEVTWLEGAHLHTYDVSSGVHLRYGWPERS